MSRSGVNSSGKVSSRRLMRSAAGAVESLEGRTLLSLLGFGNTPLPLGQPQIDLHNSSGQTSYNASTETFASQTDVLFFDSAGTETQIVHPPISVSNISIKVDHSGNLVPGSSTSTDLTLTGQLSVGGKTYSSPLLTGSIVGFGFSSGSQLDEFDLLFKPTGGSLDPVYFNSNTYIGVDLMPGHNDYNGSFASSFSGKPQGTLGPVPIATPTLATTPGASFPIGSSAKLSDAATLSGGNHESGSITFQLFGPGGTTPLDTETVTVNGNGTYTTPTGFAPSTAGTYQWVASYSGDLFNFPVAGSLGQEPESVLKVSPMLATQAAANPNDVVGTAMLSDTATLSGGLNPTGTISFSLTQPDGTAVPEGTAVVAGNGTYTPASSVLATEAGTYTWHASYSGDSNNSPANDNDPSNEQLTTSRAQPTLNTIPGNGVTLGSGNKLTDAVTFDGGFNPTGTITFYLFAPGVTPNTTDSNNVYSDVVTTPGDGFYTTDFGANSGGFLPTAAGTYQWVVVYSGDPNNSGSTSPFGDEPEGVSRASTSTSTATDNAATNLPVSGPVPLGGSVYDTAAVNGSPFTPTGTVTYYFYNTATPVFGTTTPVSTQTVTLNANGTVPNSSTVGPLTAGSFSFIGVYSGDNNDTGSVGAVEPFTIHQASSSVSTAIDNAATNQPVSGLAPSGASVFDTATVSGSPFTPTGTVTYYFFNTATPVFGVTTPASTQTVTLNANGTVPNSATVGPLTAGSFSFIGVYGGDSNYTGFVGAVEPLAIGPATPSINTSQQPASATVGSAIADTATVTGGSNPTGTVTFNLYNNPNATGTPLFTDTGPLVGGMATSAGFTATATGTDYWVATYNGDPGNTAVASGTALEPVVITPATPAINTSQQPASAIVGSSIADMVSVTGGFNPGGTVTFNLFNNPNGTGTPLFTDTETLVSGAATSKGYTATATGTDYWVATYNGDSNNSSVTSGTALEPVVIQPSSVPVSAGQFAVIGFWRNANGTAVIDGLNGGSTSTALGSWLASSFPNLFGAANPYTGTSLAGLTNAQVAAVYDTVGDSGVQNNTYLQAFAVALGIYADTLSLGGASLIADGLAAKYGFVVTVAGGGNATFNVGNNGAAFGVANGTSLSVSQIMGSANTNFNPATGLFYGGDPTLAADLNNVLTGINQAGGVA